MSTTEKFFYLDNIQDEQFRYHLRVNSQELPFDYPSGSYNVLPARILHLTYPEYLRMCRDMLGAEIRGKGSIYSHPVFKMNSETLQFVKLLNKRVNLMLWDREHTNLLDKIDK